MKKLKLLSAFIIFVLSCMTFSCKIEEEQFGEKPFVYEAKNWLSQQIALGKNAREKKQRFNLNTLDWSKAVSIKYQGYKEAIEIPLENKNITKYNLNKVDYSVTKTKLLILKDNKEKMSAQIVDVFANETDTRKANILLAIETLNGVIIISDINQKITNINFFKNGKKTGKQSRVYGIKECWEMWAISCDVDPEGNISNCQRDYMIDSWCDGEGGDGSGGYTNDIKNEIQTICLKNQVNGLMVQNIGSDIVSRFNRLFGKDETRPYITFTERNAGINGASARCNKINSGSYELWLNIEILSNASKEYLTTVVVHEMLHALMYENGVASGLQHDAMLVAYITEMTYSVQGIFPNLSDHDSRCMVLAGLYNDPNIDRGFWQRTADSFGLTLVDVFTTNDKYKGFDSQSFLGTHCE